MFLQPSQTVIPTLTHDYAEWHQGRHDYSLWYLEIIDSKLLDYLDQLRLQFAEFLYTPNDRQFHITLFISGFLTQQPKQFDDDFSQVELEQHIQQLTQNFNSSFKLKTSKINSFESALFVEIDDSNGSLSRIRDLFYQFSNEVAALDYCPHITLGLYKDAINSDVIFDRINTIEPQEFEFEVDHLTFGTYQAQILQGPLEAYHQHRLGK